MKNYDMITKLVNRAKNEIAMHMKARAEHPYWRSGHYAKAKRAIIMARELLAEAAKDLEATP